MEIKIKRFNELTIDELYEILRIRADVFVVEQECAYQDVDGKDKFSYHIWIEDNGEIKAYLRVIDKGIAFDDAVGIGRVETLERGVGWGIKLLNAGIGVVRDVMKEHTIKIEAQVYAVPFYEKVGFVVNGEEFLEDGIPHIQMILNI